MRNLRSAPLIPSFDHKSDWHQQAGRTLVHRHFRLLMHTVLSWSHDPTGAWQKADRWPQQFLCLGMALSTLGPVCDEGTLPGRACDGLAFLRDPLVKLLPPRPTYCGRRLGHVGHVLKLTRSPLIPESLQVASATLGFFNGMLAVLLQASANQETPFPFGSGSKVQKKIKKVAPHRRFKSQRMSQRISQSQS